jgi:hypothetical protein
MKFIIDCIGSPVKNTLLLPDMEAFQGFSQLIISFVVSALFYQFIQYNWKVREFLKVGIDNCKVFLETVGAFSIEVLEIPSADYKKKAN